MNSFLSEDTLNLSQTELFSNSVDSKVHNEIDNKYEIFISEDQYNPSENITMISNKNLSYEKL